MRVRVRASVAGRGELTEEEVEEEAEEVVVSVHWRKYGAFSLSLSLSLFPRRTVYWRSSA